jgi:hypothetical protein
MIFYLRLLLIVAASLIAFNAQSEESELIGRKELQLAGSVAVKVLSVEVHRVQSDKTIDLVIVIERIGSGYARFPTDDGLLRELGEFCLRCGQKIAQEAIPQAEISKLRLIAPLFKMTTDARFGFAFSVVDDACSLELPFPKRLLEGTIARSKMAFD